MPGRLRIFISSTMDDLVNERDMVVSRLAESNFEPVNAEGILPNGATSWDRISEEIETCHAFVLLSGNRYGWIPSSGPLAAENVSVTEGEYRAARELQLPILPFFKILQYGGDSSSDDARRRDAFRNEIAKWDEGQFRTEFTTARDLAGKAVAAITRMLSDSFQRQLIAERREVARPVVHSPVPMDQKPNLPPSFTTAVGQRRVVFWAGSGISLSAGLPSASVLGIEMARSVQQAVGRYAPPPVGSGIASVASDFELIMGRPLLLAKLRGLIDLPGGVKPTPCHLAAVRLFPRIITTNYDRLFECAAQEASSGHVRLLGPKLPSPLPEKFIWKIHGDPDHSDVLVVNEVDIERFEGASDSLISDLRALLSAAPLLVAGTSLRNPSILRLFRTLRGGFEGYWTVPSEDVLALRRTTALGLQPLMASLESVFEALLKEEPAKV